MELNEYELSDFIQEFSKFHQFYDIFRFSCENIENNTSILKK